MTEEGKPITNPRLVSAISLVNTDNSSENLNSLISEIMGARFLCPVEIEPAPGQEYVDGKTVLTQDSTISFKMISSVDNLPYFPAFTDWDELKKWDVSVKNTLVMSFDDFAAMILREESTAEGFVINPFGSSLPLKRPLIAYLKDDKEQRYNGSV